MASKKTQVQDIATETQKTINENVDKVAKGMEEAAQFGQENVDAVVASSKIAAKAAESVSHELMAFSKKSYEDGLAAMKDISTSKSVTEVFEKQTAYTKTMTEAFITEAAKINELTAAAWKEAAQPINQRFTAAVDVMRSVRA